MSEVGVTVITIGSEVQYGRTFPLLPVLSCVTWMYRGDKHIPELKYPGPWQTTSKDPSRCQVQADSNTVGLFYAPRASRCWGTVGVSSWFGPAVAFSVWNRPVSARTTTNAQLWFPRDLPHITSMLWVYKRNADFKNATFSLNPKIQVCYVATDGRSIIVFWICTSLSWYPMVWKEVHTVE